MNLREEGYRIDIEHGIIKPFEERVLASGMCDFALDMTFSNYRGKKRIRYDCTGYVSINELDLQNEKLTFEILEKTLLTLKKSGEFFIDREKVCMNCDTVFYNRKKKDVKFAYYPVEQAHFSKKVLDFINDLSARTSPKGKEMLDKVSGIFKRNNCGINDMLTVVSGIRRSMV